MKRARRRDCLSWKACVADADVAAAAAATTAAAAAAAMRCDVRERVCERERESERKRALYRRVSNFAAD